MTGVAERAGMQKLESLRLPLVLAKPFGAAELLGKLARLLAPAGTGSRDSVPPDTGAIDGGI